MKQLKDQFAESREFLIAIGNEKRQAILLALLEEQGCEGLRVNELNEATKLSRPAISHHLKILKQAKLVDYRKKGTKNFYFLSPNLNEINKLANLITSIKLKLFSS